MSPELCMLRPGTFSGRTIVITGGGTGLGRSMAEMLLELGARVVICGRRVDVLERTAAELTAARGGELLPIGCDVREPPQVEALLAQVYDRYGAVHGVVNNAAGNFISPTERLSYRAFQTVVDIVLKGSIHTTLAFGRKWIADGTGGVFLNILTTYAWTGSGFVVPSAVAKAGVLALTRSLGSEWARYKIRVNAIAPGPFPTEGAWSRLVPPEVEGMFDPARRVPVGRFGEHHELANLAAYLLSDYAAFIQGECVTIDGGEWLRGAGQFNFLDALAPAQWDQIAARAKERRSQDREERRGG